MTNLFLILVFGFSIFPGTLGDLVERSSYALNQYGCSKVFLTEDDLRSAHSFYLQMNRENNFGDANPVPIYFADIIGLGATITETDRTGKEKTRTVITDDFNDPSNPLYGSPLVGAVIAHEGIHLVNARRVRDSGEVAAQIGSLENLARAADTTAGGEQYWLVGLNFNLVMASAYLRWEAVGNPLPYIQSAQELYHLPPCYRQPIYHMIEYYMGLEDGKERMRIYYHAPMMEILNHRDSQLLTGMNVETGEILIDDIWRKMYELPEAPVAPTPTLPPTPTPPPYCGVPDDPGSGWVCLPDGTPATVTPTPIWDDLAWVPKPYITPDPTPTLSP